MFSRESGCTLLQNTENTTSALEQRIRLERQIISIHLRAERSNSWVSIRADKLHKPRKKTLCYIVSNNQYIITRDGK